MASPGPVGWPHAIACLLLLAPLGRAQDHPLLQVEAATTLERGVLRAETGVALVEDLSLPLTGLKVRQVRLFDTGFSYGLADNVEIELRTPIILLDTSRHVWDSGDVDLSFKARLPRALGASALAFRAGVSLPETSDTYGLGNDQISVRADFLASWLRARYQVHVNMGAIIQDDPVTQRSQNDLLRYGFAIIYNGRMSPMIEISGRAGPGGPGTDDIHNILAGLRVRRGRMCFDAGLSAGLNRDTHRYGAVIGITWEGRIR